MANLNQREQREAARKFVEYWQAADGYEMGETVQFWTDLCRKVLGISDTTRKLDFERKVQGKRIDMFYEDMGILVEQKSRGIDLDAPEQRGKDWVTPYQQALGYASRLPFSIRPRWIITCNFDEFRIYDQEHPDDEYVAVMLNDLESSLPALSFFTDSSASRIVIEQKLSADAAEIVGRLYDLFSEQYLNIEDDAEEQRSLNILITRIVFLLYAEDAGLLQGHQAFCNYLKRYEADQMSQALASLFQVLDTPEEKRGLYLSPDLCDFPYINGGLFSGEITIPQLTEQIKTDLLLEASIKLDWSGISPTIFGAAFESTLNPETRRSGGMHYTSVENIHKVIDPLFLDDLRAELAEIEGIKVERQRIAALRAFQLKLSQVKCLDPAAGSCNFLTETYLSLRKIELRVIEDIQGDQTSMLDNPIMVNIGQLYGIEINDFAVSVGKTALWIAEQQMLERTQELLPFQAFDFFPLKANPNIVCGNALRLDWNDVLPAEDASYCYGNPPFVGHQERSTNQIKDMQIAFFDLKNHGKLDYVCAWYAKAFHYLNNCTKAAFVSTNSICQGESAGLLFPYMDKHDYSIDFAYTTFDWASESVSTAIVDCVIIGFSSKDNKVKKIIYLPDGSVREATNINGYLCDGPNIYVHSRQKNLNKNVSEIIKGSQPTFCGRGVKNPADLFLTEEEKDSFILNYPELSDCIRQFIGSDEFIKGKVRYVFWFDEIEESRFIDNPYLKPLLKKITEQRLLSPTKDVHENWSKKPHLFTQIRQPQTDYLIIPRHSSENRDYIPIGFLPADVIVGDAAQVVPSATLYEFGVATSRMHMAWMRVVAGRLESRYRYSPAVWNSFVWPEPDIKQKESIEVAAQAVLDARAAHPGKSLADLYDPDKMPADVRAAHDALDAAVEAAYGVDFNGDEEKIVAHLFKLYADLAG